jgi:hypothetical protein
MAVLLKDASVGIYLQSKSSEDSIVAAPVSAGGSFSVECSYAYLCDCLESSDLHLESSYKITPCFLPIFRPWQSSIVPDLHIKLWRTYYKNPP